MTKIFAAVVTAGWLAISALGQSNVTAVIPFAFYVGNTKLPAGTYQIVTVGKVVQITNLTIRDKATAFYPVPIIKPQGSPQLSGLVFYAYGRDHFLSEMWASGNPVGLAVPKSELQSELGRQKQSIRIDSQAIAFR